MDKPECKLQPLDICNRLFHFIMKILSSKAQETVTLGTPAPHGPQVPELNASSEKSGSSDNHPNENHSDSTREPTVVENNPDHSFSSLPNGRQEDGEVLHFTESSGSCVTSSPPHIEDKNDLDANAQQKTNEEEAPLPSSTEKRAPKKIVSIKESVEDIDSIMKQRRKNKGTKKLRSFENGHDDSIRPFRSILKVGSDINDKSDSLNFLNDGR